MAYWTQTHYQHYGAREAPITLVDNKHKSLRTQGVVQGNRYHGVGVAGQLANNPLRVTHSAKRQDLIIQIRKIPLLTNA